MKNNLRKFPYPYQAMISICSDLDETPNKEAYFETIKYLNTTENTVMGRGVGLEVGNTIYFDMPEDQFSYWGTDDSGRHKIRECIKSGHIDCIHSFGDLANKREHAIRALSELEKFGCKLDVWIDHAIAPSNIGKDIMLGKGDMSGSEVYHTDLSYDFGIKYIWRGRVTSIVGQNVARNILSIWTPDHPFASLKPLLKEAIKIFIAKRGNQKYEFHKNNQLVRQVSLDRGDKVWEFMRCNPYWGGIEKSETADGLAEVLTCNMLDRLVKVNGFSIVYTHLGKVKDRKMLFTKETKKALEHLAIMFKVQKKILVTTTKRQLDYMRVLNDAIINTEINGDTLLLDIKYEGKKEEAAGLTFYTQGFDSVVVKINGDEVSSLIKNPPDETGKESVSIAWGFLVLPKL